MENNELITPKDFLGEPIRYGDTVAYVHKEYGYRKIKDASLRLGVVDKLGKGLTLSVDFEGHKKRVPPENVIVVNHNL